MKYPKRVASKPRSSESMALIAEARKKMEEFKVARNMKAILPKSKNRKLEVKRRQKQNRMMKAKHLRNQSFGAASEVRKIATGKDENED